MNVRFVSTVFSLLLAIPVELYGQDTSASSWFFANSDWGCLMNLAIRDAPDEINTLSNIELSFFFLSENPSANFRIPENTLALTVKFRGLTADDTESLALGIGGATVLLEDVQAADGLLVYTVSDELAERVFESFSIPLSVEIFLRKSTGAELRRTLHEANFMNEARLFRECLEASSVR